MVPQPSDPSENVVNEAVHKELGDSLVRVATTASSLEAEQDNEDITLVNVQDDADNEMFNVNALNIEEVTVATTVTITTEEITLAPALEALKNFNTQGERDCFQEPDDIQAKIDVDYQLAERLQAKEQEELSDAEKAILFQQLLEKRRKHFAAKRAEERRNKPPTKRSTATIMCYLPIRNIGEKGIQSFKDLKSKGFDYIKEIFDRAFKRVNTFEDFRKELVEGKEKRAGEELMQENVKKQQVEDDKETTELK
ncbi:hypothetical protein Tco_0748173 [Tanacetum coccineum]|uniref:Uncharacterized protein n=1 Tax=Tanacetum coccineum TaxID=301880 RepID=A0ABQ4YVN1_9ASTR